MAFKQTAWNSLGCFVIMAFFLWGASCRSLDFSESLDFESHEMMNNDICDYFFLDINTDSLVNSNTYGVSRYIDCDGAHSLKIRAVESQDSRLGVVFYDGDKRIINSTSFRDLSVDGNGFAFISVPSDASFFRTSYYDSDYQLNGGESFEYQLTDYHPTWYRKFQSGNIYFSVNVVQDFDHYSKGSEGSTVLATTSVLTLPKSYDPEGPPVPIIMYCHGYSHYVYYDTWGSTRSFGEQKKHWADMGFAVFDCNGARNNNMKAAFYSAGAPQFVEAMRLTYEYIVANYNVSDGLYIVGGSAGGPLALNYARFNKNVKAVALLSPWTDLYDCIWQQNRRSIIQEFYDFPKDGIYYNDIIDYYDPLKNIDGFAIPVKIWISNRERGGLIYRKSVEFYDAMNSAGKVIAFEEVPGLKHSELVSGANDYIDTSVAEWFMSVN